MIVTGPGGSREIAAADFFADYLTTALRPGEVLTGVRVPKLGPAGATVTRSSTGPRRPGRSSAWRPLARRDNGQVAEARIGLTNMGSVPVRARAAEDGGGWGGGSPQRAAPRPQRTRTRNIAPAVTTCAARADYRRHLARVLTGRALAAAAGVS